MNLYRLYSGNHSPIKIRFYTQKLRKFFRFTALQYVKYDKLVPLSDRVLLRDSRPVTLILEEGS